MIRRGALDHDLRALVVVQDGEVGIDAHGLGYFGGGEFRAFLKDVHPGYLLGGLVEAGLPGGGRRRTPWPGVGSARARIKPGGWNSRQFPPGLPNCPWSWLRVHSEVQWLVRASERGESGQPSVRRALLALQWTPASYALLSGFLAVLGLIVIVWWPLVIDYASSFDPRYPWSTQVDGLLLGIFAVMSLLVMAGADIRSDGRIILVGLLGGLVIQSWGTQTQLWTYYTYERPPLWIFPAWPIASLAINGLARLMDSVLPDGRRFTQVVYGVLMPGFLLLMLAFVWPTSSADDHGRWSFVPAGAVPGESPTGADGLSGWSGAWLLPGALGHDAPVLDLLFPADAAAVCRAGPRHGGGCFLARKKPDRLPSGKGVGEIQGDNSFEG